MLFKKNVELTPVEVSAWRKVAMGTWRSAKDPSVYGSTEFEAETILTCIKKHNEKGIKITPTVVVAKGMAHAIAQVPAVNCVVRFGKFYQRKNVDIFLQVATDSEGEDLSGMVVRTCDKKSLADIANEIRLKAEKIRAHEEVEYSQGKKTIKMIPGFLVGLVIDFLGFVLYQLNIWSPLLGAPRDGFGSAMVTSVGMLGLDGGFPPLVPYSHCPLLIAVGKIQKKAVVNEAGEIVAKDMLPISATFDHRYMDGVGAAKLLNAFREYLKDPK